MATANWPTTLQQAIRYFTDPDVCLQAAIEFRWKGGPVTCPTCGSQDVHFISTRRIWRCKGDHARQQFSVKVGTIMEDSPLGLDKWMVAIWLITNAKNGISSYELHRAIGITQKSAWFLLHRIRLVLQDDTSGGKLGGDVEADETYIGAKARNMHYAKKKRVLEGRKGGLSGKTAVMGLLQRHAEKGKSRVELRVVGHNDTNALVPVIHERVERKTRVYTDNLGSYRDLWRDDYSHMVISHATVYAIGQVHTNGMENFWSLLKRTINGTYVSVEPFHLFRYLDEQAWRFNNRSMNDSERFTTAANEILGKRLTYRALTGKDMTESRAN